MGRTILAASLGVVLMAMPAWAADPAAPAVPAVTETASTQTRTDTRLAPAALAAPAAPPLTVAASAPAAAHDWYSTRRPVALPLLYAGTALLQGFDAYSTMHALSLGGHEANPLMQGVVSNPGLFLGVKAALATASILSAERMWKDNHRTRAVVTMLVTNGVMGFVAMHNASVIHGLER